MRKLSVLHKGCIYSAALVFILFISQTAFSQTYTSPLSSTGGVDTHVYKCDTVMFEATAMEDGTGSLDARTFSAGLSMLHSPYLSILYVPLKYGLTDNFQISFSLPYLTKTLVYNDTHYIRSGYGDTMFGFTGTFEPFSFVSSTTARITLPTGNVNTQDSGFAIPMGYGGYTASLQQSISTDEFDAGFISVRLFISAIGIYYFASEQTPDATTKFNYDKTYAWSVLGGAEFGLTENLALEVKANYIDVKERQYKSTLTPGQWIDANDSVKQINILPFVKYQFLDEISGQAGIIYPIKSIQDKDLAKTYDGEWKIALGIEKRFTDGSSYENGRDDKSAQYDSYESKGSSVSEGNGKKKSSKRRYKKKRKK